MTKDELTKWFLCDEKILLTVIKSTNMVNKEVKTHGLTCTTGAVLGRAITMGAMMGAKLKNQKDNITAIIIGDGPVGRVVTVSKYGAVVKGYLEAPDVDLMPNDNGKIDVGGAVGKGKLRVISDYGFGKPYIGEVDLVSGEIAEDFAMYYANSLQQPCAIGLGVLMKDTKCISAGGFLVEVMPDATEADIAEIEIVTNTLKDISSILKDIDTVTFVNKYFGHLMPKLYATIEPKFKCDCTSARVKRVIKSLPKEERATLYDEKGNIEVLCDFCGKVRCVNKGEIEKDNL